jgi:hypothetical protein
MSRLLVFALSAVLILAATPTSQGALLVYVASLDGPSEAPPNASLGTGFARIELDVVAHVLNVTTTFSGLTGTTTNAHIHAPTALPGTGTAGVATEVPRFAGFPMGVTAGSYSRSFDTTFASTFNPAYVTANGGTVAGAESALAASLAAGTAYFNIHTSSFPGGEIRGFLQPIPEPTSLLIWGLGAAGLIYNRRRNWPALWQRHG